MKNNKTHGSLFSGIGGFDIAAEWAGWQNTFHCEINPFGQKILKHYWPKSTSYADITQTDFTIHRGTIDVLSGGFPCQPFSTAGKRKGTEDERHLWPEMLRAIREIHPTWVVGENVRGFIDWDGGMVFDQAQADLEIEGFQVLPFLLPAVGVNAPHERYRIFIVAYSASNRRDRTREGIEVEKRLQPEPQFARELEGRFEGLRVQWDAANPGLFGQAERKEQSMGIKQLCQKWDAANPGNAGLQRGKRHRKNESANRARQTGPAGAIEQFCEVPNWRNFPTESPVCGGNDGLPSELDGITFPRWRNESIKSFGNAIVPQVAYQIFNAINMYDEKLQS